MRQPRLNRNTTLTACKYHVCDNNIYFVFSSVSSFSFLLNHSSGRLCNATDIGDSNILSTQQSAEHHCSLYKSMAHLYLA